MTQLFANNASSKLAASISTSDTVILVNPAEAFLFPQPGASDFFRLTIENATGQKEIMLCTARTGNQLTVQRAQEGTVALAYAAGGVVEHRFTAKDAQNSAQALVIANAAQALASNANQAATNNAYKTQFGKSYPIQFAGNDLQAWAGSTPRPASGLYEITLTTSQNGLPSGTWLIDLKRSIVDEPVTGFDRRHLEARSLGTGAVGSENIAGLIYQNTCSNGIWTGWKEIDANKNTLPVKGKGQTWTVAGEGTAATLSNNSTAFGSGALGSNTIGGNNTAIGATALEVNTTGGSNTAIGYSTLVRNTTGGSNTAIGATALGVNTTGGSNTAIGAVALGVNTTGGNNTAIGLAALARNTTGSSNTAIGAVAMFTSLSFANCTAVGYDAQVTNSNQVQLGDSNATTYAYGAVQNRSDIRDKKDVQDTDLGLAFILAQRAVKARWDHRENYRPPMPEQPQSADGKEPSKETLEAYEKACLQWLEDSKLKNIKRDGSKARKRFHQMLIAQEVQAVCQAQGVDFGGLQDHSKNGGDDVMSLGYEQFIPVLIKAVQEQQAQIDVLTARLNKTGK